MTLLETEDLHKTYKIGSVEVPALRGVSVSVEQGEFLAIMGASGSGKSTLMHLLGLLDTADRGRIRLMGEDVTSLGEDEYAFLRNKIIGFVFQQFNLMARSTALENVALPLWYGGNGRGYDLEKPRELLRRVGLANRMNHRPNELSGGQQQRVAIARALANSPLLILADEPTGNLDSKSGLEIMDIFSELHRQGLTIVLVTHDEKVASRADRVIRMHDGKIAEDVRKQAPASAAGPMSRDILRQGRHGKYSAREFREHFMQAWRMIFSNKLRSFLSILGVLIGVACVITMLALGRGAKQSVTEQLSRLGSNLLSVRPGSMKVRGVALEAGAVTWFTVEDARALKDSIPFVKAVSPEVSGQGLVAYRGKNWTTRAVGVTPSYVSMRNQEPVMGRFFTEDENRMRKRVVLLGQTVINELFGEENPVGKIVKINRVNFQVIGILRSIGANSFRDQDDVIVMPLMTAMKRVLGKEYLDEIDVEITALEDIPAAQEAIQKLIIQRHKLPPERYDTFNIRNYTDIQQALSSTTQTFSVLLGCVAAISLVVGGIGIMNIMLVSVKERTREIGLRKAIGATQRDILLQFLVESVLITFLGGMMGILAAVLISWLITALANWTTVITTGSLLLAFVFSVAVGIIFGLWPAKQAAELEPILALRYE